MGKAAAELGADLTREGLKKIGGWDLKRILPDPVFDCQDPNIPAGAKTFC